MRTLLAMVLACLPLVQAQDARLLKTVEPDYARYSEELTADFDVVNANVTMTVMANGKPLALEFPTAPLPIAVAMALKDYEFRPEATGPHGNGETQVGTYQVTLTVPIRSSKSPRIAPGTVRIKEGVAKGLMVEQVRPEYPEFARHNQMQGTITLLDTVINTEGRAENLQVRSGAFVLIQAAYEAVKQWRWRPYLLNRQPVEVVADIPVRFSLD